MGRLKALEPTYIKTGHVSRETTTRKKRAVIADEETGEKLDRDEIKKRNQRYLNVLTDLHRLRDHYYTVYLTKLEEKVKNQRKEILAREEKLKLKLLKQEQKRAKDSHKLVKRLPHHHLTNDEEFLRRVPKSHYYHLTAVENLMKSRGLLKHKHEIEEFWSKATADSSFWKQQIPPTVSPDAITEHMLSRYSSITNNSKQGQTTTVRTDATPIGILKKTTEETLETKESANEAEVSFPPKPKFPKLHAFNMKLKTDYGKSLRSLIPEPSTESSGVTSSDRHRRRKLHQHIKTDAYQLAVVNTAMTERLLKKHALIAERPNPITELSDIWCGKNDTASTITDQVSQVSITTSEKSGQRKKKNKTKDRGEVRKRITTVPEENEDDDDTNPKDAISQPLSMEMMLAGGAVVTKEVKETNPVWVNYAE